MATRVRTEDGSWTVVSDRYGETYRSHRGALVESRHVFVEGAGVAARLAGGRPTRVLEIGLGTALNLVVSAEVALRHGTPLSYVAVEHDPLTADDLASLELERAGEARFVEAFLAWRRTWAEADVAPSELRFGCVHVAVRIADASTAQLPLGVDALYLDGFSPRVNPELWTDAAIGRYVASLAPSGVLATYSVSGHVRRALEGWGLSVERLPGPPNGKREMLRAVRAATETVRTDPHTLE